MVKNILCGLQKTNYPISYTEQKLILQNYMTLLFEEEYKKRNEIYVPQKFIYPSNFIGPSSKALQIKNITEIVEDVNIPNFEFEKYKCEYPKDDYFDAHSSYIYLKLINHFL